MSLYAQAEQVSKKCLQIFDDYLWEEIDDKNAFKAGFGWAANNSQEIMEEVKDLLYNQRQKNTKQYLVKQMEPQQAQYDSLKPGYAQIEFAKQTIKGLNLQKQRSKAPSIHQKLNQKKQQLQLSKKPLTTRQNLTKNTFDNFLKLQIPEQSKKQIAEDEMKRKNKMIKDKHFAQQAENKQKRIRQQQEKKQQKIKAFEEARKSAFDYEGRFFKIKDDEPHNFQIIQVSPQINEMTVVPVNINSKTKTIHNQKINSWHSKLTVQRLMNRQTEMYFAIHKMKKPILSNCTKSYRNLSVGCSLKEGDKQIKARPVRQLSLKYNKMQFLRSCTFTQFKQQVKDQSFQIYNIKPKSSHNLKSVSFKKQATQTNHTRFKTQSDFSTIGKKIKKINTQTNPQQPTQNKLKIDRPKTDMSIKKNSTFSKTFTSRKNRFEQNPGEIRVKNNYLFTEICQNEEK